MKLNDLTGSEKKLDCIPYFAFRDLAKDPFIILYTSGTCGQPKGVVHSNRSTLASFASLIGNGLGSSPGFSMLAYTIGHASGSTHVLLALLTGRSFALFRDPTLDDLLQAVQELRIASLSLVPHHAIAFANGEHETKYDLTSLKVIVYTGTKYPRHLIENIKNKFKDIIMVNGYGTTECVGSIGAPQPPLVKPGVFESDSIGTAYPGSEFKIVHLDSGKALPPFHEGEICMRGAPCFIAYLNRPEETAEAIDHDGWYHSGDIGYVDEYGDCFVTDRIKELIKFRHWTIIPAEIELFLHSHKAVGAVCVIGVPHIIDGSHLRAYVELREYYSNTEAIEQELINLVARK